MLLPSLRCLIYLSDQLRSDIFDENREPRKEIKIKSSDHSTNSYAALCEIKHLAKISYPIPPDPHQEHHHSLDLHAFQRTIAPNCTIEVIEICRDYSAS